MMAEEMQGRGEAARGPAVAYIVPSYSEADATHMAHLPRLLDEIGKLCDLYVIILRARGNPALQHAKGVYVCKGSSTIGRAFEVARQMLRLRRSGCDKVFIRISRSAATALNLFALFGGTRVYYWTSGQGRNAVVGWAESPLRRARYELADLLLKLNIRRSFRLVTGPERMVEYYRSHYGADPRRTIVFYNDIDVSAFEAFAAGRDRESARRELGVEAGAGVVLFVGRVSPLKGGLNLVPLAERLGAMRDDVRLLVVGQLGHLPEVEAEARRKRLVNLAFCGPVANSRLPLYFRAADVFVLPSESEGCPRVLLEAMAMGTPVVAFDVGGVKDIVDPRQLPYVVARGDLEGMAAGILELLDDGELRRHQSAAGRERVRAFDTRRIARLFYERIVRDS